MSPTYYRFLGLFLNIIFALIIIIIFKPEKHKIKFAFFAGIFCAIYDFIIEAIAYKYGAWFCYGGIQFIKIGNLKIDFLHVPIDMIVGFVFYGMAISIMSEFPDLFRRWKFFPKIYGNKRYDLLHKIVFLILISINGAGGDFISKNFGIWETAKWWTFHHTAFIAWLSLNGLTIGFYYSLKKKFSS